MQNTLKVKIKLILMAIATIYVPIFGMFILGKIGLQEPLVNLFGINPRDFSLSQPIAIMGSWLVHGDFKHLMANSVGLFWLILCVAFFEQKYFKLLALLVIGSGLSTWLLGEPNSVHVGASGLLFALFGYVLSSAIVGRKWIYFLPITLISAYYGASYYLSFLNGLKIVEGISFAAHFGGLITGIIVGFYYEKKEAKQSTKFKKSFKDTLADLRWDVNYKMKRFFK